MFIIILQCIAESRPRIQIQLLLPVVALKCGATNIKKLERIQFRALRLVFIDFESDYWYETLLDRAGLPTLELSRKRAILIDVYKNVMHQSPALLWNSYKPVPQAHKLQL